MRAVTLELVQAKQVELADLIQQLQQQAATALMLPAVTLFLRAGERYAGVVLDDDGNVQHHVVLMPQRPDKRLEWGDAVEWAESIGGVLPTLQEQSLLFANCKPHIEADWHWSSQAEGNGSAWYCYFDDGYQNFNHQYGKGAAVAVRRLNP